MSEDEHRGTGGPDGQHRSGQGSVGVTALLHVDLRMRREGLVVALLVQHDRLPTR